MDMDEDEEEKLQEIIDMWTTSDKNSKLIILSNLTTIQTISKNYILPACKQTLEFLLYSSIIIQTRIRRTTFISRNEYKFT